MKKYLLFLSICLLLLCVRGCQTPGSSPNGTVLPQPTVTSAPVSPVATISPHTVTKVPVSAPTTTPSPSPTVTPEPTCTPSAEDLLYQKIEEHLSAMTLSEKIYQLFIVTPEQLTGQSKVTATKESVKENLELTPVGGIIYFAKNLINTNQTTDMLTKLQSYALETNGLPLFLCVDEEGGRVARIGSNPEFSTETVGPMSDVTSAEEAYQCGNIIGNYLNNLGFNVDFAPVADVITHPENTVIGDRSFGTDADIVTEYAMAYSDGLHANRILSTLKHFPGHGATKADSHEGYAYSDKTYEELLQAELLPFAAAKDHGVDMIMVAHISLPNVIGDATPCSLSHRMITEVLRNDLQYEGLIITDALNMGAISKNFTPGEAAVKAIEAGVDLLLMPTDLDAAYSALCQAVTDGKLSEDRIDESVRRILKVKLNLN